MILFSQSRRTNIYAFPVPITIITNRGLDIVYSTIRTIADCCLYFFFHRQLRRQLTHYIRTISDVKRGTNKPADQLNWGGNIVFSGGSVLCFWE